MSEENSTPAITAPIDIPAINDMLENNNEAKLFAKLGLELLEQTNRTNIITFAQFEPFIELFNHDKDRLEKDPSYKRHISHLFTEYRIRLGINLYEPTIVVVSEEDRTEIAWLDKCFTRIASDTIQQGGRRDNLKAATLKAPTTTRDSLIMQASVLDLMDANSTPEMQKSFSSGKTLSAIVNGNFFKYNMSESRKKEILEIMEKNNQSSPDGGEVMEFYLDDGD